MRPHHLAFCALGPYPGEVEVDFDELLSEGLFLIWGPTGAGKTFLLDALCYALYGEVPGERPYDTLPSDHAPPEVSPWVELEFAAQGDRWRIRRVPAHERAKKRGSGTTEEDASADLKRLVGETWHPVAPKIHEVNPEVERLLGLTASEFQQVVLLPQGRFEQVLRSKTADREKLLRTLFDTSIYASAASWLDNRAQQLREAAAGIERDLLVLRRRVADEWHRVFPNDEGDGSPGDSVEPSEAGDSAHAKWPVDQTQLDKLLRQASSAADLAADAADDADTKLETANDNREHAALLAKRWDRRTCLRQQLGNLADARARISASQRDLLLADAAEKLRKLLDDEESSRDELDQCITNLAEHYVASEKAVRAAKQATRERRLTERNLLRRYLKGIAAVLAAELDDTEPCPVCGSLTHPNPAEPSDDAVSVEDVESASEALGLAVSAEAGAAHEWEEISSRIDELPSRASDTAEDHDAIASVQVVEPSFGEPQNSAAKHANARAVLDALTGKRAAHKALADTLDSHIKRSPFASADEARSALLDDAERKRLRNEVNNHDQLTDEIGRKLSADELQDLPDERPDTAATEQAVREWKEAAKFARTHHTRVADACDAIGGWTEEHRDADAQHATALAEADLWSAVADRCNGRSAPRVSLQRWVLSAYLEQICEFANRRLGAMSGGRYRLSVYRESERRGAKAGLGLRVHDAHTGAEREVSTLSGGETFQASLSLALGVADVVTARTGGVRLDVLFVDEGFGTLDSEALQLAMDELDCLREGGRAVGLISHVSELRERIHTGIEVHRTDNGSDITVGAISQI